MTEATIIVGLAFAVLGTAAFMAGQRAGRAFIAWADRVLPPRH